ncbi:hypothetical protein [Corynebacterium guangdongense]|uniref:Flp pilus assembly protein TadB n=1 Tax=Corynebacterium guangdongense TaxID=1783348 RepID=A0ABU1ZUS6_9CORY|nr:hypothetical protein [Corynebacterium guangdongense]MDR7328681.1 Flp pilus assembly protein TadB [Corynebacterium guangdongense]WJZ17258.1 hypothetical protein CGUA_03310 [Corynebacterium guangdongense]
MSIPADQTTPPRTDWEGKVARIRRLRARRGEDPQTIEQLTRLHEEVEGLHPHMLPTRGQAITVYVVLLVLLLVPLVVALTLVDGLTVWIVALALGLLVIVTMWFVSRRAKESAHYLEYRAQLASMLDDALAELPVEGEGGAIVGKRAQARTAASQVALLAEAERFRRGR